MPITPCLAALLLIAADAPEPIEVAVPSRSEPVSYIEEVAEVLGAKCLGCHNAARAEGKLDMEEVAGLLRGGKRGPAIVRGEADESLLFRMASHRAEPTMPPADAPEAEPLTPGELGLIKLWIDAGAPDDSEGSTTTPEVPTLGPLPPVVHPVVALDMTPDGRLIAAGRGNLVHVYDAETGDEVVALDGLDDIVQSIRFRPDGRRLAAGGYRFVTIWDLPPAGDSGDPGGSWPEPEVLGPHADRVLALDFRPDGRMLAAGGGEPSRSGEVKLWDLEGEGPGRLARDLTGLHADTVFGLRFSPDGSHLATAGADRLVRVVDLEGDGEVRTLEGHTHHVLGVDWKSDGKQLASAGADNVVKLWDAAKGEQLEALPAADKAVTALRWIPEGPRIAGSSADGRVRIWDVEKERIAKTMEGEAGYPLALATPRDGSRIVTGGADGVVRVWDGASGRPIRSIGPPSGGPKPDRIVP